MAAEWPATTCQCTVRFHFVHFEDGRAVAVIEEPIPDMMAMLFDNCEKCGLPYHNEKLGQPFD